MTVILLLIVIIVSVVLLLFFKKANTTKNQQSYNNQSNGQHRYNKDFDLVELSKSGLYIIDEKGLSPLHVLPGNGSINHVVEMLGYPKSEVATVISHQLQLAEMMCVEKVSLRPLFFIMKDKSRVVSMNDLKREYNSIDWDFQRKLF